MKEFVMTQFKIFNGPGPTTAARAAVTTGTAIKTMLQIKGINSFKVVGWGVSMDGAALAAGVEWELLTTGTVAATVTATAEADVLQWFTRTSELDTAVLAADKFTLGVAATGYTSTAEGTITVAKTWSSAFITPTREYIEYFPRPIVIASTDYLRIRCKAAAAINAICWALVQSP